MRRDTKHSVKAPRAWRRWELQADKTVACGTQVVSCFRGGCRNRQPPPRAIQTRTEPYASQEASGAMCFKTHGAAGAVNRPVVPHAPCEGKTGRQAGEDRRALEPDRTTGR